MRDVVYKPEARRAVGLTLNKRGFLAGRSSRASIGTKQPGCRLVIENIVIGDRDSR